MLTNILCGLLVIAVCTAAFFAYQSQGRGGRLDALQAQHTATKKHLASCVQASKDDTATITTLTSKLAAAAGQAQDVRARANAAEARAGSAAQARDSALVELQALRETTYDTHPDARTWGNDRMPGVLSVQLRNEWADAAGRGTAHQGRGRPARAIRAGAAQPDAAPEPAAAASAGVSR